MPGAIYDKIEPVAHTSKNTLHQTPKVRKDGYFTLAFQYPYHGTKSLADVLFSSAGVVNSEP